MSTKNIGLDVEPPEKECEDEYCPFHGKLPVRGQTLEGEVKSIVDEKTVVIEREYAEKALKYERYEKRRSGKTVHRPPCIDLEKGDEVLVAECRPISKTKSFVVVEKR
ncbi:MAG: Ribosomal protein S17 [Candidatus Methanohalarchaeum thermophilum]|uniref:Small ribosomal subunit protein uS17 n=1 Tax=Methanohalarchaeum thermophilum TaxID=1903181 RepID=A0A1Q6DX07_METT1|nr:MAG: Ribosomal protein S17 [Candidatus Methanohalarchaeum thermophilum]